MYKSIYRMVRNDFDRESFREKSLALYEIEKSCSYRDFLISAQYCYQELKQAGAGNVCMIPLKSDGKTAHLDCIMPEAWDIEDAELEIMDPVLPDPVLARFKNNTLCVANRSLQTPDNGITAELVNYEDVFERGVGVKGKVVLTRHRFPGDIRSQVIDAGGIGIVSSYSPAAEEAPDETYWINGWGSPGWYHTKDDKRIFCFSVTPKKGDFLAELMNRQTVFVRAMVKSRTYSGTIHTITGLIPGKSEEEICLAAHIYEPFITDNASGAIALVEICRMINHLIRDGKIPTLERTVRFIISQEKYGLAHYFENGTNAGRTLCVVNNDSICLDVNNTGIPVELRLSPASMPFFGDLLLRNMLKECEPELKYKGRKGCVSDDTFVSDRTIGIPSNWLWTPPGVYHHNSDFRFVKPDWAIGEKLVSLVGTYAIYLASANEEEFAKLGRSLCDTAIEEMVDELEKNLLLIRNNREEAVGVLTRLEFIADWQVSRLLSINKFVQGTIHENEIRLKFKEVSERLKEAEKSISQTHKRMETLSKMERRAANIVPVRIGKGMPFSLVKVPIDERHTHPQLFTECYNWIDGKRSLLEILKLVNNEYGIIYDETQISHLIEHLLYLEKYGYTEVKHRVELDKEDIRHELRSLGISKGDNIIVHSSLSAMGYVKGGPTAVCEALMELVTEEGVLMMPSFNHYTAFGEGGKGYYSPLETPTVNGAIADTFWRMKGVYRSLDPSHAFAAWGGNAAYYVNNHHNVPTMGYGSPLELLERDGGKAVLINCPDANTFIHVVEMTNDVPCLGKRTEEYDVKLPDGKIAKGRTWAWRDGECPIYKRQLHYDVMRKQNLITEGYVGAAKVIVFRLQDFRSVYEKFLKGESLGVKGCRGCCVRPRMNSHTVKGF